jgi:hypothetical protein
VDKVNELINENINLSDKLERALEERDRAAREGRNREIELKVKMGELVRENEMLRAEKQGIEKQMR